MTMRMKMIKNNDIVNDNQPNVLNVTNEYSSLSKYKCYSFRLILIFLQKSFNM